MADDDLRALARAFVSTPGVTAYVRTDGGRAAAGFTGKQGVGDCVCRSIAIATGLPYRKVYDDLAVLGKAERPSKRRRTRSHPRTGVHTPTIRKYLASLGWTWVPTMRLGSGCTVHLDADELPAGRLIVKCSKHLTAMIDGIVHDTHDPSRGGTRCVYGFWYGPDDANPVATWQQNH